MVVVPTANTLGAQMLIIISKIMFCIISENSAESTYGSVPRCYGAFIYISTCIVRGALL